MTTPTTPAADAVRDAFEQWVASEGGPTTESLLSARSNDDHYKGFIWLRQSLAVFRAATALATARESALIAERDQLRAAIEVCLSFVHADDRSKPSTDPDLCGEIVRVRLSGLCALAEAVTPGIRLAAHQAFVARTLDALSAPAVEGV